MWLADRRGWAYEREGVCLQRALANAFDVDLAYVEEQPDLARIDFDLLVVAFWGETYHQRFAIPPSRVIKQVASHRWQNEDEYGRLSPAAFAAAHLRDAGAVCAISQRLVDLLAPVREVVRVRQGVAADQFARSQPRTGPLTFGWAGNSKDRCKGLADVLLPAAGDAFPLRVADGGVRAAAMADFYRELDVLCIASSAEGGPLPLLEAMASGCFVIATDVGVVPEMIRHGDNGLIVARSPAAFRDAMQWCAAHVEHVRAAGMRSIAQVRCAANTETVAAHWRPVLLDALARQRAQPVRQAEPAPASDVMARAKAAYAAHYTALNSDDLTATYAAASFYYDAELAPVLPGAPAQRALDVGSGYGLLLRFLAEHGYGAVDGVELDGRLHQVAAEFAHGCPRWRGMVHQGDALHVLPACTARYDLVTAFDIVEHFDKTDAVKFAAAVRGVLAPGGRAVFRTPNMANVLGAYSRCVDFTHQVGFTEQSLAQLLALAGFRRSELLVPAFSPGHALTGKIERSRAFHRELFELQDRAMPACFDKNVVMVAYA